MNKKVRNVWIVNQPYHLNDLDHYGNVLGKDCVFICIEHRKVHFPPGSHVFSLPRFTGFIALLAQLRTIRKTIDKIGIQQDDRILVFNGQEIVNNVALSYIYRKFSKNICVVDDGSSGYQFYLEKMPVSTRLTDKIKMAAFRFMMQTRLVINHLGNLFYFSIHPVFVRHLIFPYRVNYKGNLKVDCLIPPAISTPHTHGQVIFLSQPFYLSDPGYLSYEEYVSLLKDILARMSRFCDTIVFKTHPNDYPQLMKDITDHSSHVVPAPAGITFEQLLENETYSAVYSFNSNGLLYAFRYNVKTVWMYNLLSEQCRTDCMYLENIVPYNNGLIIHSLNELKA